MASVDCEKEAGGAGSRAARRWRQYLAAAVVNIAGVIMGTAYGWTAPILPLLQSENSPLPIPPITEADASWLASIVSLTRIIATPIFMYFNDRYGHKITGYTIAALSIISWVMLLYASSFVILVCTRVLFGIATGGILLLVPSFTSDIAEDDIKGQLGLIFGFSMNFGTVFSYAMGSYTSYSVYHISCLLVSVFFIGTFFWLPESPLFLMAEGRTEGAKNSLRWFRNGQDSEFELLRMRIRAQEVLEKRNKKFTFSGICDKPTIRALFVTIGLLTNKQFSGTIVITTYTVTIFQESGSTLSPSLSTVLIGAIFTLGPFLSTLMIEKAGRRPLLLFTDVFNGASLAVFGTFLYLKHIGWDMEYVGWIPPACLSLYVLGMSLALGPLSYTIATEMVSSHAKGAVQTTCIIYGELTAFISTLCYAPLNQVIGQHGTFWLFSGVCFVGSVCIFLMVPETKNRSIEDVVAQMRSDCYIRSVLRRQPVEQGKATKQTC